MIYLKFIAVILIPLCLGYSLARLLCRGQKYPLPLNLAMAYGLGTGIIGQWMLLLGILKVRFTFHTITTPLIVVAVLLLLYLLISKNKSTSPQEGTPSSRFDLIIGLCVIYVGIHVYYVFWRGFNIPIASWDAIATHAFNAKVLFYDRGLQNLHNFPHNTYPLQIPFMESWLSITLGNFNDQLIKGLFPCFFASLLIIQFYLVKAYTHSRAAWISLALLVASPFLVYHATVGYRDMTLLFYNFAAMALLLMWYKNNDKGLLIIASLMAGFTTFVKLEGAGYLLIHLASLGVMLLSRSSSMREKLKTFFLFAVPGVVMCAAFQTFKYFAVIAKIPADAPETKAFEFYTLKLALGPEIIERFIVVLQSYVDNMFWSNNWNIVFALLLFSLLRLKSQSQRIEVRLTLLALGLSFLIYWAGYTLTQHYYWLAETETVLSRCLMHFFPLVAVSIAFLNFSEKQSA